jgi:hypothetical protein
MEWLKLNIVGGDYRKLTNPPSNGTPVNPHEVRQSPPPKPDYDKMREAVHPDPHKKA